LYWWTNKIKSRLIVALFSPLQQCLVLKRNYWIYLTWCPQKSKQNLIQQQQKLPLKSLSCKQHSLIRNGVGGGRSMRRNRWPTTYEISDTSFSCIQRRTRSPWTCRMHHSPLGNRHWNPFLLSQPSSIALAGLQPLVVRVLCLCKILQAPHIC